MKKYALTIVVLLVLAGVVGVVLAVAPSLNIYETKIVTINLREGWNLIPLIYDYHIIEESSAINLKDIEVAYVYSPIKRTYVKYIERGEVLGKGNSQYWKSEEIINEIVASEPSLFTSESNIKNLMFGTSAWVYLKKPGYLTINVAYDQSGDKILLQGWNFLVITPEMDGVSFEDIKGDCNVEKAYLWDAENQQWGTLNNLLEDNFVFTEIGVLGDGFVFKVSNNCKLGAGEGNVPSVPNLPPENSYGCRDSDGKENFQVKGYVTTTDGSGKPFRGDDSCELSTWNSDSQQWSYKDVVNCSANTNNDTTRSKADRCLVNDKFCGEEPVIYSTSKYCPNGCNKGVCDIVQELR